MTAANQSVDAAQFDLAWALNEALCEIIASGASESREIAARTVVHPKVKPFLNSARLLVGVQQTEAQHPDPDIQFQRDHALAMAKQAGWLEGYKAAKLAGQPVEGWQLVPVEPTPEMLKAGCLALESAADELMAAQLSKQPHAIGRTKMRLRYRAMLSALSPAPASPQPREGEWQPIETAPNDSDFRWYGLHVKHNAGHEWFEAHYVAHDDDGQMILPSGDNFDDWAFSDFEFWCAAPAIPAPPVIAEKREPETK